MHAVEQGHAAVNLLERRPLGRRVDRLHPARDGKASLEDEPRLHHHRSNRTEPFAPMLFDQHRHPLLLRRGGPGQELQRDELTARKTFLHQAPSALRLVQQASADVRRLNGEAFGQTRMTGCSHLRSARVSSAPVRWQSLRRSRTGMRQAGQTWADVRQPRLRRWTTSLSARRRRKIAAIMGGNVQRLVGHVLALKLNALSPPTTARSVHRRSHQRATSRGSAPFGATGALPFGASKVSPARSASLDRVTVAQLDRQRCVYVDDEIARAEQR